MTDQTANDTALDAMRRYRGALKDLNVRQLNVYCPDDKATMESVKRFARMVTAQHYLALAMADDVDAHIVMAERRRARITDGKQLASLLHQARQFKRLERMVEEAQETSRQLTDALIECEDPPVSFTEAQLAQSFAKAFALSHVHAAQVSDLKRELGLE